MEMLTKKKELIDWISSIDNPLILNDIYNLKKEITFDFDKEFAKGLTLEEFRTEMKKRIRNYPLRK
jgi:hypothetical protein